MMLGKDKERRLASNTKLVCKNSEIAEDVRVIWRLRKWCRGKKTHLLSCGPRTGGHLESVNSARKAYIYSGGHIDLLIHYDTSRVQKISIPTEGEGIYLRRMMHVVNISEKDLFHLTIFARYNQRLRFVDIGLMIHVYSSTFRYYNEISKMIYIKIFLT